MSARLTALILGLATAGTATAAGAQGNRRATATTATQTTVTVTNNLRQPVRMFVEWGEFDRRLGVVPAGQTATLQVPDVIVEQAAGEIQLSAEPLKGLDIQTQPFPLKAGDHIEMTVPAPKPTYPQMKVVLPTEELAKSTLTVQNDRPNDVIIYADDAGPGFFGVRLGTVKAHSTATLNFPVAVVQSDQTVQIVVEESNGMTLESQAPLDLRSASHFSLHLN